MCVLSRVSFRSTFGRVAVAAFACICLTVVCASEAQVSTLAGSGSNAFADATGTAASFNEPKGVAISPDGATLYVADALNHGVRVVDVATRVVTTLAGSG